MNRRIFIQILVGLVGLLTLIFLGTESSLRNRIIGKLKYKLMPPAEEAPAKEAPPYILPAEGQTVSVEKALNSRCTSDYTGNQQYHHWGMFDNTKRLTKEQMNQIVALAGQIPRFTEERVEIIAKDNIISFVMEDVPPGIQRDWMMVESGMQQQAVGLVCAALGVGMVFRNLGMDGKALDNNLFGTVREELNGMKPSYEGSYWHSGEPSGRKPWIKGNLPDPSRDGRMPLISALKILNIDNKGGQKATSEHVGQLLWAARGRTPHLYKSKPWGMTIPFWSDRVETSCAYLIQQQTLYKYENWGQGRPTHSITPMGGTNQEALHRLQRIFPQKEKFIILSRNDRHARAYWEIGYQLINILVQAYALDIEYRTLLCDNERQKVLKDLQVNDSIAVMAI